MSVQKNTPNFLNTAGLSFTTLINETMDLISDPATLGIYLYLASKPSNWLIREKELQARFKKGRDFIRSKMSELKTIGLLKVESIRDDGGKIIRWESTLLNYVQPAPALSQNHITEKPASGKTRRLVNPTHTNKRVLKIKDVLKIREREKQKKPLSVFEPNEANQKISNEYGLDLKKELESFIERHKGKKTQYEFKRWLEYAREYKENKNQISKPTATRGIADTRATKPREEKASQIVEQYMAEQRKKNKQLHGNNCQRSRSNIKAFKDFIS